MRKITLDFIVCYPTIPFMHNSGRPLVQYIILAWRQDSLGGGKSELVQTKVEYRDFGGGVLRLEQR